MANLDTPYLVTHIVAASIDDLQQKVDTNGLPDGCIATLLSSITVPTVLNTDKPFFVLAKNATNGTDNAIVLGTANSISAGGLIGFYPGRWIRQNTTILG